MIEAIRVRNYKSVVDMKLRFGQVNVFIGENGSGKSNILEAMAMAAASEKNSLTKGYLVSRGIRVIDDTELMSSNFHDAVKDQPIMIDVYPTDDLGSLSPKSLPYQEYLINSHLVDNSFIRFDFKKKVFMKVEEELLEVGNSPVDEFYEKRIAKRKQIDEISNKLKSHSANADKLFEALSNSIKDEKFQGREIVNKLGNTNSIDEFIDQLSTLVSEEDVKEAESFKKVSADLVEEVNQGVQSLVDFIVFTPENTALRNFYKEGQVEPLGVHGEGLLRTLRSLRLKTGAMKDIEEALSLFGWYDSFTIPENLSDVEDKIFIKDKFIRSEFDQRSANEGFLFVLFYMALIVSENTPKIFAIDNVDTSLNPKLCRRLMEVITKLCVKYDKQVFLTTHNPAILDGVDLKDSKNKLFVVSRDYDGETIAKPVSKDKNFKESDGKKLKFSEAFLRGYIGGLPKGF
ncbi:AAA family ATPase [Vibrio fortis]|uniref:AAA family ATPase n=1 Tax=Vibrio fortis TaxID=212667 RepID=A0A5N3S288_9VIBR|nr:AAA family ATPase [Vibrio fortis]KAB0300729.1 AAA family ATPase [Vibrio fortis]